MAEREGFEPPEPCGSTVFKTAAFDHSATSPLLEKQPPANPLPGRRSGYAAYLQPRKTATASPAIIAVRA